MFFYDAANGLAKNNGQIQVKRRKQATNFSLKNQIKL
jgi:hypothetical protein